MRIILGHQSLHTRKSHKSNITKAVNDEIMVLMKERVTIDPKHISDRYNCINIEILHSDNISEDTSLGNLGLHTNDPDLKEWLLLQKVLLMQHH